MPLKLLEKADFGFDIYTKKTIFSVNRQWATNICQIQVR